MCRPKCPIYAKSITLLIRLYYNLGILKRGEGTRMQEYLHESRLGRAIDGIGFHIFSFLISFLWFILLWGVRAPSFLAGAALYGLILLLRRKMLDDHLARKEIQLRAAIGGELALERLLLSPPERAHFEAAVLLSVQSKLTLLRCGEDGILCSRAGEKVLVYFLQRPASDSAGAQDVLSLQRRVKLLCADRGLMCVPCGLSPEAREQALNDPPVSFCPRDRLIRLFGGASPATDEQLVALGRRRRQRPVGKWTRVILSQSRIRRYACYGCLLLIMHQFTQLASYAAAGLLCVFLAAFCRCVRQSGDIFCE